MDTISMLLREIDAAETDDDNWCRTGSGNTAVLTGQSSFSLRNYRFTSRWSSSSCGHGRTVSLKFVQYYRWNDSYQKNKDNRRRRIIQSYLPVGANSSRMGDVTLGCIPSSLGLGLTLLFAIKPAQITLFSDRPTVMYLMKTIKQGWSLLIWPCNCTLLSYFALRMSY